MAVLQTLRTKFGLAISIIVALGLLSFIIDPGQIQSAVQSMSSKYDVGEINGKSISYTDFQADVERYTSLNELMTGRSASSEEEQVNIRNTAWQALIDKYLLVKEAKAAGINVGEAEIIDLTTGNNPSPVLLQNAMFVDESGNYSPSQLVEFVKSIDSDTSGNLKLYWNFLQNTIYTQQFYQKYGALFNNSSVQNALMLKNAIAENNETADVDFVMVPLAYTLDSTIVVSDDEIKSYYKSHKNFFKQKASRDIEYVVFEVVPSADDIAETNDRMTSLYDEFASTDNMKAFLLKNSERQLSSYWYKDGELNSINSEINGFVFSNAEGASPIFSNGNSFYAARVMDSAMKSDSVYVKHMLFASEDAAHLADSLINVVNKDNFSSIAAVYSADQQTMADGEFGAIGWMTQNYMIPGFESVIDAQAGKPFVLNTTYGTHIVLVTEKTAPVAKKQVAIFEKTSVPSNETYNTFYAKANNFATAANGSYENYKAAVDSMGVYSHPLSRVAEGTANYGAIDNAKEVTRWIFDNKKGKVSNIITVNQNYFFIATVKDIHAEGFATLAEVSSAISQQLYQEKLSAKMAENVAEKIKGLSSMEAIADALGATVSSQSGVTFASYGSASLDPQFLGAIASAPLNKISAPVAGNIGVYVFQVKGRDNGSFYTEDDAASYEAQKAQYKSQQILPVMMDDADVKDNRARFF